MLKLFRSSRLSLAALVVVLGASGCASNPSNQDLGGIIGAVAGAGLGSLIGGGNGNTIATVVGGIAGYMIGGNIGRNMDRADQERAARLAHQSLSQPAPGAYSDSWQERNGTPIQSQVTTQPSYQDQGRQCKSFTQETTIRMNGQPQTAVQHGVACFEYSNEYPQGMWVIQH